jgi:ubiquitin carboxyl-terminal hydrolase 48
MKLLLMKLEALLANSSMPGAKALIPSLFRGTYSYVTTCARCGRASQGSSRENDFYELPLQVQGMASLIDSLVGGGSRQRL